MKICILSIVNIKHMSLISLYTSFFDRYNIKYDIIYIDKYNEEEYTTAQNVYKFPLEIKREWSKVKKLKKYWGFKKYAQSIMESNKYDFIIVWRTETSLMFSDFLLKKFKNKYCLNIRDYCYEKNSLIYRLVSKIVNNSTFTTISSEGYKLFLPKSEYLTIHSYNEKLLNNCTPKSSLVGRKDPIHICFIGYVRFFDIDKKLIDALGNDPRYIIQFFGEGAQYLEDYAHTKGINNIEICKGFSLEETSKYLQKADVINNLYGHNNIALDTAISTKYYYALYMKLPIIVFESTYMEQCTQKTGIGFSVNDDFSSLANDFYNWYHSLDFNILSESCEKEIEELKKVNNNFFELLNKTFR